VLCHWWCVQASHLQPKSFWLGMPAVCAFSVAGCGLDRSNTQAAACHPRNQICWLALCTVLAVVDSGACVSVCCNVCCTSEALCTCACESCLVCSCCDNHHFNHQHDVVCLCHTVRAHCAWCLWHMVRAHCACACFAQGGPCVCCRGCVADGSCVLLAASCPGCIRRACKIISMPGALRCPHLQQHSKSWAATPYSLGWVGSALQTCPNMPRSQA
jgi:hypothetical protein